MLERSNGVLYAQAQEHFEKEQRDTNWITSFVAVPYNNLYDRLFRLAEEYGKIKAEVYIDKSHIYYMCKFTESQAGAGSSL